MKLLLNKFRSFNLPVDGIAILREMEGKNVLAVGERTIDINSCNFGYIRTSGIKRYRQGQRITGCDFVNDVVEDLFLVLILDESKNSDAYLKAARQVLDSIDEVQITAIDINKESIQRAESIPASLRKLIRVSFTYTYQEVGDCETGICDYVADVECGIEPCESKTFCERVLECVGDSDCTLHVGSGCCDYVVEGIDLFANCFTVTFPEDLAFNEEGGGFNFFSVQANQFAFSNYPTLVNTTDEVSVGFTPTIEELLDALEANFNSQVFWNPTNPDVFTFERLPLGFKICYSGEEFLSTIRVTLSGANNQGFNPFQLDVNSQVYILGNIENLDLDVQFELNVPNNTFQVLINSEWVDVTDEVVDGTWQRLNVCDDVITEWRIIDSEENVIDSGEVTATCEGSSEETKPVCEWLQEHQTAIEELQNNPTGLTCETLADCQTIIDIETELDNKANTADLADVAFSGDYNDLINQPTIPTAVSQLSNDAGYQTSAQVTAAIAAAKPITLVGIDATATALTGSVTNGVLGSILIPANTMTVGTIAEIEAFLRKVSPSAQPAQRLWINSANNLTGATQLALLTGANTTQSSKMELSFIVTNTGLTIFNSGQNSAIDDSAVAAAVTDVAVNWGVNQYLIHTANNATGETTTNIFLFMKKATP